MAISSAVTQGTLISASTALEQSGATEASKPAASALAYHTVLQNKVLRAKELSPSLTSLTPCKILSPVDLSPLTFLQRRRGGGGHWTSLEVPAPAPRYWCAILP